MSFCKIRSMYGVRSTCTLFSVPVLSIAPSQRKTRCGHCWPRDGSSPSAFTSLIPFVLCILASPLCLLPPHSKPGRRASVEGDPCPFPAAHVAHEVRPQMLFGRSPITASIGLALRSQLEGGQGNFVSLVKGIHQSVIAAINDISLLVRFRQPFAWSWLSPWLEARAHSSKHARTARRARRARVRVFTFTVASALDTHPLQLRRNAEMSSSISEEVLRSSMRPGLVGRAPPRTSPF